MLPDILFELEAYLKSKGHTRYEGNSGEYPMQQETMWQLAKTEGVSNIMEIGFNCGHSAAILLDANPTAHVTSFDIGWHNYISIGKEFIDAKFPNRHTLILGNSLTTVPEYAANRVDSKSTDKQCFDIILIDGGHEYNVAKADVLNCRNLANNKTLVILDDVVFTPGWDAGWTHGPTQVWKEMIESNEITEILRHELFRDDMKGRGFVVGRYNIE